MDVLTVPFGMSTAIAIRNRDGNVHCNKAITESAEKPACVTCDLVAGKFKANFIRAWGKSPQAFDTCF